MNFRKNRSRSRKTSVNIMVDTEKWRKYSRKTSRREIHLEDLGSEEEDEEDTRVVSTDWEQEFSSRKGVEETNSEEDIEVQLTRKQTLLLATLLPNEILLTEKFDTTEPRRFVGVLLMADVSGYTALSERYNNTGKGGTYRLTVTLNTYIGSLIELINNHGGDIIKFAGDAFLALWKTDKRSFLGHTIHTAIACALLIQHSFSTYETDVKVNLRVKLAISAGNLMFGIIGNKIPMNYVIFGLPVIEAKLAESLCESGEVKVTPSAWGHCYSRNYIHIVHDDGHVTVHSILYDPREKDVSKPFRGFGAMIKLKKPFAALENLPESIWNTTDNLRGSTMAMKSYEALNFRAPMWIADERNIGAEIRKFMIRPVLTQIDARQPLEYLTEMRQVSVLFVTLKPSDCPFPQLMTIVNNSYQIICEIVYKSMGCVNKIILFDKDVMILVIFGLRGYKHESEAQAALKCACSVKKSLSALDGVKEVSMGVTTGQVYCGVVGHPLRREFTVIGATVNKAARLMCMFRNKITCDETTFVKSKMSTNGFTLQPETELKGIKHAGKIYEYNEEIRVKNINEIPILLPLLDRKDEMEYFENWLDDSHHSYRDFDAILLVGESRLGKSRLLEWMARYAKNAGYSVCCVSLTSIHSATPYLALTQIMNRLLDCPEQNEGFEKEEKIVQLLKVYHDDLCYLNDILKVRFAYHEGVYTQDVIKRAEKAKYIFSLLIDSIPDTHVVFLDDLQNLDPVSWEFITIMINSMKMFTVMSVVRGKFSSVHNWLYSVLINGNIRKIALGPLASNWIPALACQILDVEAVPFDLCEALRLKCKGRPGLVELFIVHLFSNGALELKRINNDEIVNCMGENLQFPDPELLQPQALNVADQIALNQYLADDVNELGICIITRKEELNTDINVQNLDALIMMQIDSLTPYQQLLLKIGSVIGDILSRDLLENIMYENNPLITAKAIKRLFSMRILTCANVRSSIRIQNIMSRSSNISDGPSLTCACNFYYDPEDNSDLPKYAFCKVLKFKNKKSRSAFYELLPMNQKKEFHARIVNYLQNNKQKCPHCGGTVMVVQSTMDLTADKTIDENNLRLCKTYEKEVVEEEEQESSSESYQQEPKYETKTTGSEILPVKKQEAARTSSSVNVAKRMSTPSAGSVLSNAQFNPILKTTRSEHNDMPRRKSHKRVTLADITHDVLQNPSAQVLDKVHIFNKLREVTEAKTIHDWRELGVVDSDDDAIKEDSEKKKRFFCLKIEKGVSQTDFSKCTCAELKIMIYEQLIHHANRAEMKLCEIEFMIKLSYLHVLANNMDDALAKLEDSETFCNSPDIHEHISAFDIKRFLGKIHSYKAAAFLMSGKLTAAKMAIGRATRIYRINLDTVTELFGVRNFIQSLKLRHKKYRQHEATMKADSIFCLNIATLLYSAFGDGTVSRASAYRAINLLGKFECNVVDICEAFNNALQVDLGLGFIDATAETENLAIQALKHLTAPVRAEELHAFGKLFLSVQHARIARGLLASAVHSGFRAITVSRFLLADNVSIDIIPGLFYILLGRRRVEEAIDVAKEAYNLSHHNNSLEYETWYYALCIDLILDAGCQLESPNDISRFAERALHIDRAEGGRRRLVVGLWTYWLRIDQERKAKRFEAEALGWMAPEQDDGTLLSLMSAMRLAEGMIESLARKMDDLRKVVDLMELRSLADSELARLENDTKLCRPIYPRWIMLKANSLILSGRRTAGITLMNQALEEARKLHNRLEESIIRANFGNSTQWLQSGRTGRFMSWRDGAKLAKGAWHELLYNLNAPR